MKKRLLFSFCGALVCASSALHGEVTRFDDDDTVPEPQFRLYVTVEPRLECRVKFANDSGFYNFRDLGYMKLGAKSIIEAERAEIEKAPSKELQQKARFIIRELQDQHRNILQAWQHMTSCNAFLRRTVRPLPQTLSSTYRAPN